MITWKQSEGGFYGWIEGTGICAIHKDPEISGYRRYSYIKGFGDYVLIYDCISIVNSKRFKYLKDAKKYAEVILKKCINALNKDELVNNVLKAIGG